MEKMDEIVKLSLLYDFYGELLTEHQREIYEDAVYQDMSLSEIAEEHGISRQGVHDLIKRQQQGEIQAIFLYPLNALMEDQKERLQELLDGTNLTFAVYNGNLPHDDGRYDKTANGNGALLAGAQVDTGTGEVTGVSIDLADEDTAVKFIDSANAVLEEITTARATLGAQQNRLDYVSSNLNVSTENLSSAESRIRDVDVAKEVVKLSKLNILNQSTQAMVSQAKQQS